MLKATFNPVLVTRVVPRVTFAITNVSWSSTEHASIHLPPIKGLTIPFVKIDYLKEIFSLFVGINVLPPYIHAPLHLDMAADSPLTEARKSPLVLAGL